MRYIECAFVVLYICLFGHMYRTIVPRDSFPVGYVIQAGDFDRGWFGSTDNLDLATDPKAVIGHKVVKKLHAGTNIRMSDIQ